MANDRNAGRKKAFNEPYKKIGILVPTNRAKEIALILREKVKELTKTDVMKTILLSIAITALISCQTSKEDEVLPVEKVNPVQLLSKNYFVEFDITNEAYIDVHAASTLVDDNSLANDTTHAIGYYAPFQYNFTSNKVRNIFMITKIRAIRIPSKPPIITIKVDGNIVCCDTAFVAGTYKQYYTINE